MIVEGYLFIVSLLTVFTCVCPVGDQDFTTFMIPLRFDPGTLTQTACGIVTFQDDGILESSEYFFVVLSSIDPDVMVGRDKATVLITDNDGKTL